MKSVVTDGKFMSNIIYELKSLCFREYIKVFLCFRSGNKFLCKDTFTVYFLTQNFINSKAILMKSLL